jgi:hypothetical protein
MKSTTPAPLDAPRGNRVSLISLTAESPRMDGPLHPTGESLRIGSAVTRGGGGMEKWNRPGVGRRLAFQRPMKKIIVDIEDSTKSELVEKVEIDHLSDLGDGVKNAVDDFVQSNKGVVLPPVAIRVTEVKTPDAE